MAAEPIAVVGMACRLPGAADLDGYWAALRAGVEGISHFDRDDLIAAGADPAMVRRPDFVPAKGVLAGSSDFDWAFFGYSRAEAAGIDPQQRVFLACASRAIDDAGLDPVRFPGRVGVFAGADRVAPRDDDGRGELAAFIGQEKDFLATRVAYKLGLRGPALTVQTACSTSLTAIHLAAQSLRGGECDAALAGGVTVTAKGECGYVYEPGGILSPDGHCRPFDQRAAGTVPSEGVGVVVLRRLSDALRDGDRIAAVLLGSAINNDGAAKLGFTAPSIPGQSDAIRFAQQVAGVDPADLDYIEAHGTATPIGDPVEVAALTDVFRGSTDATGSCWLGAVKSNLGHTGAAAGVAAFIKTTLMLRYAELVPTLHFDAPNPLLDLASTPFKVCTRTQPWPARGTALAAVSSFGVGGTNAHAILQGPPARVRPVPRPGPRLLVLSAATPAALHQIRLDLADRLLAATPAAESAGLPEVARTLADRRVLRHRQSFVVGDPAQAADQLRQAPDPGPAAPAHRVAFLFPGQGTLRSAAGAAAYRLLTGFRGYFDEIRDEVFDQCALDLSPVVNPGPVDWFADTVHQQLGLFALGYALGRQLADWGLRPAALLGNSSGEYVAATLAGVWTPADAAALVHTRAQAMWATPPGRMAAIAAPAHEVIRRAGSDGGIAIAVSGTAGVVISGPRAEMDALLAGDALHGLEVRPLNTERAFHGAAMEPAAQALRAAVASMPGRRPRLRLISNVSGDWSDPEAVRGPDYWADQLRRPVLLAEGMTTVLSAGCDTFVELGPGSSMIAALRQHAGWDRGHVGVPLLGRSADDGERGLLRALGTLWERGVNTIPDALIEADRPLRCALPAHPFAAEDPEIASSIPLAPHEPQVASPAGASADRVPAAPTANGRVGAVAGGDAGPSLRAELAHLWSTALGVPSVADTDDFFALGGESLMAVNLMSRVRERTELSVSVTEFSQDPTFGRLLRLADAQRSPRSRRPDQAERSDPPRGVVTLRDGTGRPLFLVADATGTALVYRTLAGLIEGDRAVLGLEPVGGGRAYPRVEEIAAGHVEALREVQPGGPYTIGGWSFGAVLGHEMARQLAARGERVDLLICLDGFVPVTGGRSIGTDPEFLGSGVRLGLGAALGVGPVGHQVRRSPALRRVFLANMGALLRYRPWPVDCPAVVFKAGTDPRRAARLGARLAGLYPGGVRVHPVRGDHWSMLAPPHVHDLARQVLPRLPDSTPSRG